MQKQICLLLCSLPLVGCGATTSGTDVNLEASVLPVSNSTKAIATPEDTIRAYAEKNFKLENNEVQIIDLGVSNSGSLYQVAIPDRTGTPQYYMFTLKLKDNAIWEVTETEALKR